MARVFGLVEAMREKARWIFRYRKNRKGLICPEVMFYGIRMYKMAKIDFKGYLAHKELI